MGQQSTCYKCQINVEANTISEGRAYFRCSNCGRKWSSVANYGRDVTHSSDGGATGGGVAGAIVGASLAGPVGAIIGCAIGAVVGGNVFATEDTEVCIRCGGVAKPTGESGGRRGYQCGNCNRFFLRRVE